MARGKFGGKKLYNFYKTAGTKKQAQKYANDLRRKGKKYRILPAGKAYAVYEYLG